jgi:hypothetical protein
MSSGHSLKKNENLTDEDKLAGLNNSNIADNQGDMWSFMGVLPDSSFVHTVHCGKRNLEEAELFIGKIKAKSDGESPLISSDDWFYEKALLAHYGVLHQPWYKGRGRPPHPYLIPKPELLYVQVTKKRDGQGNITEIGSRIVYGTQEAVALHFEKAKRSKHINTDYIESRNGKFRKDNARLIRKTLCHSKKVCFHNAMIQLVAQIYNYCRPVEALKQVINHTATKFEQKYKQVSAAMAEGLIDRILSLKDLLCIRPKPV